MASRLLELGAYPSLWTDTWPPNSTAILAEGDSSGGKMLDSVSKVDRYRKEANRCAELAKEASPPTYTSPRPGGTPPHMMGRHGQHLSHPRVHNHGLLRRARPSMLNSRPSVKKASESWGLPHGRSGRAKLMPYLAMKRNWSLRGSPPSSIRQRRAPRQPWPDLPPTGSRSRSSPATTNW
jgi:hypothetical protein